MSDWATSYIALAWDVPANVRSDGLLSLENPEQALILLDRAERSDMTTDVEVIQP